MAAHFVTGDPDLNPEGFTKSFRSTFTTSRVFKTSPFSHA